MSEFNFFIPGNPIPWKRPGQSGNKRYDTQGYVKAQLRQLFYLRMGNHPPLLGKIRLRAKFYMPEPKQMPKSDRGGFHCKKPDLDNLLKIYLDCMSSICFRDDSQIYSIEAVKVYSDEPHTELHILELCNGKKNENEVSSASGTSATDTSVADTSVTAARSSDLRAACKAEGKKRLYKKKTRSAM